MLQLSGHAKSISAMGGGNAVRLLGSRQQGVRQLAMVGWVLLACFANRL